MSEKDRCYSVVEELETKLRNAKRETEIFYQDNCVLRSALSVQEIIVKDLKKENRNLKLALERGIS